MDSILTTTKKLLGMEETFEHFDGDLIVYINSALMGLKHIGVATKTGMFVSSKETNWSDFFEHEEDIQLVKTFVYFKVKLMFDPPSNSFTIEAINKELKELEWRLMVLNEGRNIVPVIPPEEDCIYEL